MTKHRPGGLRAERKLSGKATLLCAAREQFATIGFHATTLRMVAARAGLTTGAVFNNWPSKEALYIEAIGHPAITPETGADLLAVLKAIADESVFNQQRFAEDTDADYFLRCFRAVKERAHTAIAKAEGRS